MHDLIDLGLHVAKSNTIKEFLESLERFTDFLGATTYSAFTAYSTAHNSSLNGVHNMPTAYLDALMDHEEARQDPVMQHCRVSSLPIAWNASTYADAGMGHMWEHMAQHGLREGVSLGLHVEDTRHFCIGMEWNRHRPLDDDEKAKALVALQTLAVFAEPVAYRLLRDAGSKSFAIDKSMTDRELECLHWAGRGMTDDLIALILQISPRTVRKHIESCTQKLLAANRTEAAVRANQLGLTAQFAQPQASKNFSLQEFLP
jgi:DNA-binding CsgD family transcriptional regulator